MMIDSDMGVYLGSVKSVVSRLSRARRRDRSCRRRVDCARSNLLGHWPGATPGSSAVGSERPEVYALPFLQRKIIRRPAVPRASRAEFACFNVCS
jgi:hypothetical protein